MAVNFQRRNIGVLADTPSFEDVGRSSYVDYAAAAARAPTSTVMPAAVKQADVQKTPALAGPQTPEAMAEYEAAQLAALKQAEEAALRQRNSVKNPLNVIGNAISAVVGTPFRLLDNAIGGGNNDLAAPFRPNQTAQDRYQSKLADISTAKLGLMQTMDGMRANQTQAITNMLTDRSKLLGDMYDRLANLAANANDATDKVGTYTAGLADLMQDPIYGPVAKSVGIDNIAYSPDLARRFAKGKDVTGRLDTQAEALRVSPMNSQWMADRVAAAKELYPDVPVQELASNSDLLLSPAVSSQYNKMLATRGGAVAESTARGRREGAPPISSNGGGSRKTGKPNVSGMSVDDLIKGAGL
jgi:hypothetical protein